MKAKPAGAKGTVEAVVEAVVEATAEVAEAADGARAQRTGGHEGALDAQHDSSQEQQEEHAP